MSGNETPRLTPGKAYFTERELAERLAVSVKWLQKMRLAGGGIPYVKIGASVRYRVDDILAFETKRRCLNTSDWTQTSSYHKQ